MSRHTPCIAILSFISLFVITPSPSYSDEKPKRSPLSLGEKIRLNHHTKTVSGPTIQIDENGTRHLAWIEGGKDRHELFYASLGTKDKEFPTPIHINKEGPAVAAIHQSPGLALGPQNQIHLSWSSPNPESKGNPFASLLRLSSSHTKTVAFSPPIIVNDDAPPTSHTFDNLCVDKKGTVHLAWIDSREGRKNPKTYVTRSLSQGNTVEKNVPLQGHTCVCCRTSLATAPDGSIYIAWRQVIENKFRETVVARSIDGGKTYSAPIVVGHDRWDFQGCPHRPASIAVDGQGRLYVTWYTEGPDDVPGIYLATSDDHGQTFSPRTMLNQSKSSFPDKPQMAVDPNGRVIVAWEELSPVRREIYVRYSLDRGASFSSPQRLNEAKAQHPAIAINGQGDGAIAWVEHAFPNNVMIVQNLTLPPSPSQP